MAADELTALIQRAKEQWVSMSPKERRQMLDAQRESYVISEVGFGSDADEAEYMEARRSGDALRIAECERRAEERMERARKIIEAQGEEGTW